MPQRFLQFDIDSLNDVNVLDMDEEDVLVIRALLLNPDVGVSAIETVKVIKNNQIESLKNGTFFNNYERKILFKASVRGEVVVSIKIFILDNTNGAEKFFKKIFRSAFGSVFGLVTGGISNTVLANVVSNAGGFLESLDDAEMKKEKILVLGEGWGSIDSNSPPSSTAIELKVEKQIIKVKNRRERRYGSKLVNNTPDERILLDEGNNGSITISIKDIA